MTICETEDVTDNEPEIDLVSDTTRRGSNVRAYSMETGGNWWIDFKDCDHNVFVANARAIITAIPPEKVAWIDLGRAWMRVETFKSAGRKIQPRITKILNDFFDKSEEDRKSQLAAVLADLKNLESYGLEEVGDPGCEELEWDACFDFHRDVFLEHVGVIAKLLGDCFMRIAVHEKVLSVGVSRAGGLLVEDCAAKFKKLGWTTRSRLGALE